MDYAKGVVTFPQPPAKGRKNILVQYSSGKTAGQVKGLRLKLVYNLDVWTSTPEEHASLPTKLASVLISNQEALAAKGIQLRLTRGRDFTTKEGIPNGVLCKRLECIAEADMFVKIPMHRMEQIPIRMK